MLDSFVVGIPRCNEPAYILAQTFEAINASTVKPSTVVIVDNGDAALDEGSICCDWNIIVRPSGNIGCAGAWNRIYELANHRPLVMLNGDCAVAPDTFEHMLSKPAPTIICALGFGCFRLDHEIYERVGPFDEAFWPIYFEDTDYRYRLKLAGIQIAEEWPVGPEHEVYRPSFGRATYPSGITHGWRPLEDGARSHWPAGERAAWAQRRWISNKERYEAKWGGPPGEEKFTTPFGK